MAISYLSKHKLLASLTDNLIHYLDHFGVLICEKNNNYALKWTPFKMILFIGMQKVGWLFKSMQILADNGYCKTCQILTRSLLEVAVRITHISEKDIKNRNKLSIKMILNDFGKKLNLAHKTLGDISDTTNPDTAKYISKTYDDINTMINIIPSSKNQLQKLFDKDWVLDHEFQHRSFNQVLKELPENLSFLRVIYFLMCQQVHFDVIGSATELTADGFIDIKPNDDEIDICLGFPCHFILHLLKVANAEFNLNHSTELDSLEKDLANPYLITTQEKMERGQQGN